MEHAPTIGAQLPFSQIPGYTAPPHWQGGWWCPEDTTAVRARTCQCKVGGTRRDVRANKGSRAARDATQPKGRDPSLRLHAGRGHLPEMTRRHGNVCGMVDLRRATPPLRGTATWRCEHGESGRAETDTHAKAKRQIGDGGWGQRNAEGEARAVAASRAPRRKARSNQSKPMNEMME